MQSILVRINVLKYNFEKQKSIWLVKCSDNRDSNYWTVFYKMKIFDCSCEKKFVRINRSIRPWNYPNLSLLSDTNIKSMGMTGSFS